MRSANRTARRTLWRALVAFGVAMAVVVTGVVPAAHAVPRAVELTFEDDAGATLADFPVVIDNGGYTTNASGVVELDLEPGAHTARGNSGLYSNAQTPFAVDDIAGPQAFTITVSRHATVSGSVPVAAASGMWVNAHRWNGSAWVASGSIYGGFSDGDFTIPLAAGPGIYTLFFDVDSSSDFFDGFLGPLVALPDSPTEPGATFEIEAIGESVDLETVTLFEKSTITGQVVDELSGDPVPGATVSAGALGVSTVSTETGLDGSYSLTVHPGYVYTVYAEADGRYRNYYDGYMFAEDADPVVVPNGGAVVVDFELIATITAIFGVVADYVGTDPDDFQDEDTAAFPGGIVHLYKKVGTGWVEVDTFVLDDFNDMDDPLSWNIFSFPSAIAAEDDAELEDVDWIAPGDYRIFFSHPSGWVPVLGWSGAIVLGGDEEFEELFSDEQSCYLDVPDVEDGQLWAFIPIFVHSAAAGDDCDPATVNEKPGGPTKPKPKPTTPQTPAIGNPSSMENPDALDDESGVEDEEQGTGEVTPTPDPAPAPSETATPVAGGDSGGSAGFDALPWILALLALLVVGGGGYALFAVRRRA